MPKVLVTGSSAGLGRMVAEELLRSGHHVVVHARDLERGRSALEELPPGAGLIIGDVSSIAGIRAVAERANDEGPYDAVVHNVGVGYREPRRVQTVDGLSQLWTINVLAPYLLTALIDRPSRLVYLSSGMHLGSGAALDDVQWANRPWSGPQAYSESKLHDVLLAFGVARRWPQTTSNVVSPGWVATRMGGSGAPDDLGQAHLTQVELAVGDSAIAAGTAGFYYHLAPGELHPAAHDEALQDRLLAYCADVSRVSLDA